LLNNEEQNAQDVDDPERGFHLFYFAFEDFDQGVGEKTEG